MKSNMRWDGERCTASYWESKDEADNIDEEIRKNFCKGYPNENTFFEDSLTFVLIQDEKELRVRMLDTEGCTCTSCIL